MKVGIDFGTTRTVVAAALGGGRYATVCFDVGGAFVEHVPGLAVFDGQGLRVGWDGASALPDAKQAVRSLKRLLSLVPADEPVPALGGATCLDATTAFARHVRDLIHARSSLELTLREPLELTLAVPANASSRQRYTTIEGFARAGFVVDAVRSEPTAAAIEYAWHHLAGKRRSPKRYVVVYDLGGGTFDTSAVSLEGRRFELIATEGIAQLGGDDFDEALLQLLLEQTGAGPVDALGAAARARLLEACRHAKEALRPTSQRLLVEPGPDLPADGPIVIETGRYYERCTPAVDRTLALVDRLFTELAARGIDTEDPTKLGAVYLVGGAAAFPPVGRALRKSYGKKLRLAPQPHAATAVGLAVAADPAAEVYVREAATRHFGVWREAEDGREKVFDLLLTKGTVANGEEPLVIRRSYHPVHRVGHLRFLECSGIDDAGQPAGDVVPWRTVSFPYDHALADKRELGRVAADRAPELFGDEVVETYTYATHGGITAVIENRTRGYSRTYRLGALS